MSRAFVSEFLLPLVRGGALRVGRPLSVRDVQSLSESAYFATDPIERQATTLLAQARQNQLAQWIATPVPPTLDQATWRLGAVVHNLLAMSHPSLAQGPGAESRVERLAHVTLGLAKLGPPPTMHDVLLRHSVIARLPEIIRQDHTVRHRLGKTTFIGQRPPSRALALSRLRDVRVETTRRIWLRDVGVPGTARATFAALTEASPLGEAIDPLRLDPPPSWSRVLSVLRFPHLCRAVAGRLCGVGVGRAGDALTAALYRLAALQDPGPADAQLAPALAYGIQFLAHLVWLDVMFRQTPGRATAGVAGDSSPHQDNSGSSAGRELAVLLAAAEEASEGLVWPPDIDRNSDLGQRFARQLATRYERHDVHQSAHWSAARRVAEIALGSGMGAPNAI